MCIKDSGTTCVVLLIRGNKMFTANVGDSRCIAFSHRTFKQLTVDHKPWVKEERARILLNGGIVTAIQGKNGQRVGPERVWNKRKQGLGLAMSRSIGDLVAKEIGVISSPGNPSVN